jgi:small subunit ribosomal protein S4
LKFSEFALQLREKQKTKRYYGVSEKQFRRYVGMAEKAKEVTGLALLKNLEQRLDNVVSTLGFATSRRDAKQIVSHGHVLVNGKKVNVPSYSVSKGDVIEISTGSKEAARIMAAVQGAGKRTVPTWLEVDHGTLKGVVKDLPGREEITLPVEENMIVEYYSR